MKSFEQWQKEQGYYNRDYLICVVGLTEEEVNIEIDRQEDEYFDIYGNEFEL